MENILSRRQSYHVEIYAEKNKHGELNPNQMTTRNWRKYIDKVACQERHVTFVKEVCKERSGYRPLLSNERV